MQSIRVTSGPGISVVAARPHVKAKLKKAKTVTQLTKSATRSNSDAMTKGKNLSGMILSQFKFPTNITAMQERAGDVGVLGLRDAEIVGNRAITRKI